MRRLTLADRQLVEIAKGLARDPAVLILDEATSALAPRETEWLLALAGRLAAEGKLVIYISHRLQEVRNVAKRITVFRNGMTVARHDTNAVGDDQIIAEMLGRRLDRLYPERKATATDRIALRVRGLSAGQRLRAVDLDLYEGEVLGVGGLQGHGQRELFQALFGIGRARGSVELWGKPLAGRGPRQRLSGRDGIALVPEDRRGQGLLLSKSVGENLTLSVIPRFSRFGLLNSSRERALVEEMMTLPPHQGADAGPDCRHALGRQSAEGDLRQDAAHRGARPPPLRPDARRRRRHQGRDLRADARARRQRLRHPVLLERPARARPRRRPRRGDAERRDRGDSRWRRRLRGGYPQGGDVRGRDGIDGPDPVAMGTSPSAIAGWAKRSVPTRHQVRSLARAEPRGHASLCPPYVGQTRRPRPVPGRLRHAGRCSSRSTDRSATTSSAWRS